MINYRFGYEFTFKKEAEGKFVLDKVLDDKRFFENPYIYFIPPVKRHPNPSFASELFWKALLIFGREEPKKRSALIAEIFGNEGALRELCLLIRDHFKIENSDLFHIVERFYLLNCLKLNDELPHDVVDERIRLYKAFLQSGMQRPEGRGVFKIESGSNLTQIYPNHDFSVVFREMIFLFDKERVNNDLILVDRVFNPVLEEPVEQVEEKEDIRTPENQVEPEEEDVDALLANESLGDADNVSESIESESEYEDEDEVESESESEPEPEPKVDYVMEMSKMMEESLKIVQGEKYESGGLSWPEIIQRGRDASHKCSYSLSSNYGNELKKMKDEYAKILVHKEQNVPLIPPTPQATVRDPKNDIFAGVKAVRAI